MSDTAGATADRQATTAAWLVVILLVVLAAGMILTAAFSADNTPSSIDGTTATTSHLLDGS